MTIVLISESLLMQLQQPMKSSLDLSYFLAFAYS